MRLARASGAATALAALLATSIARGQEATPRPPGQARLVDIGLRLGYARPVGAFDGGTHALDMSHGGVPAALDVAVRLPGASSWTIGAGVYGAYAPTLPRLCTSASECVASVGADTELGVLVRVRAPRLAFVSPEAEIGIGWSWSSRSLEDKGATSTRRWSGPVPLRAAVVPSIRLGGRTRVGFVAGGSIARSTSFSLEAPGLERGAAAEGGRLHGTLDLGLRFGLDLGS